MGLHFTKDGSALVREFLLMRKQLNLYLRHFPRYEQNALSATIRNTADKVFGEIIRATKLYHKGTSLRELDINHQLLRSYVYEAYELGYFDYTDKRTRVNAEQRYMCISKMIDAIGAMIGAWLKEESLKEAERKPAKGSKQ